jgi:Protein of unknown function (DUF4435)
MVPLRATRNLTGTLMHDLTVPVGDDAFLDRVRLARRGGAVLKTKLIALRSEFPDSTVLVFEGDDDKIVYGQWIRRIRPNLRYEPFPCGGKKGVRDLKNVLARDLAHLASKVFFFVDRDYDDLRGFSKIENVFMTDAYAVENYLVDEQVLEELLRDEFPCHAEPQIRKQIIDLFRKDYCDFLHHTAIVNFRLYLARCFEIRLTKELPKNLRQLVIVKIGNIAVVDTDPKEVVACEREPTAYECEYLAAAFKALNPKLRYRGKFAIKFFQEWLAKLAVEFLAGKDGAFGRAMPAGVIRRAEFVLSNFASKSQAPTGLESFINAI